jgi:hypothetical protein
MAIFDHVRAGDVISSDFFNSLLDKVTELEGRITSLEHGGGGSSQGMIDHFDPPAQVQVGQVLTMFGNFDFPPTANTVLVDGNPVPGFRPGSNNLQLLFLVPSVSVPAEGRNVTIKITNSRGIDQKSYRLLPAAASTVPAPSITAVVNNSQTPPSTVLQTGRTAQITGNNFAANPADNIIRFRVQAGINTVTYPKPGQPPLTIDVSKTSQTQIVVTVPLIDEITVGSTGPATLEVGVGSAVPASVAVAVQHTP